MSAVEAPDEAVPVDPDPPAVEATAPRTPLGTRLTAGRAAGATDDGFGGIDWSGRGARGGSDDDHDGGEDPTRGSGGGSGTRRLAVVAGVVSFAYVAWVVVDLVVLWADPIAYTSMHESLDSLGVRLVLTGAWLGLLFHGLDGLRVVALDAIPRWRARDRAARSVVAFVLFATWIPTSLILLWPSIRGWFAP